MKFADEFIKLISDLRHDRWFSPGIPDCSTNKTDCHDIVEILLKVELIKHHNPNPSHIYYYVLQIVEATKLSYGIPKQMNENKTSLIIFHLNQSEKLFSFITRVS